MKGRTAGWLFLVVCVILAALLLTRAINAMTSGIVFAVALVVLGLLSRGFRRHS